MRTRRSYSQDTKNLFQHHKDDGKTLLWIAHALNISFNTIKIWSSKISRGENLEDKRKGNGRKKTFSDEALIEYIHKNPNATLWDIGNSFCVSDVAILKRLRSLKYSYKKKK